MWPTVAPTRELVCTHEENVYQLSNGATVALSSSRWKARCLVFARRGRGGPDWVSASVEGQVLATLGNGEQAVIESVLGGSQMQARLENMGLRPGKTVTRLSAMPSGGPIMVECGGTRIALGRGIAQNVRVRSVGSSAGSGTDRNE